MQQTSILYVHHDSGMSGSTLSLINLLKAIDQSRYSLRVALFSNGPAKILIESLGIPVDIVPANCFWTFPGPSWKELGFYLNLRALVPKISWEKYVSEIKPDIIHLNDKACLQVGISIRNSRIPIVWHLRSSYFPSKSRLQANVSKKIIRRLSTRLIAISEDEMDGFIDLSIIRVIHNSVDLLEADAARRKREIIRKELGLRSDEIAVATLSTTINQVRGTWDFINSAGIIHQQIPREKVKFFVVASIPPRNLRYQDHRSLGKMENLHPMDQAISLVKKNDLQGSITFTGYRADPLAVMAGMDIIVVCNRHGVLGRMPFEAMAVGTPIVVTGGHSCKSSIVIDKENAIIVRAGDPQSIAQGIIKLIIDPELRTHLVTHGLSYVRDYFDPQKNAKAVEQVYREILTRKQYSNNHYRK